MKPNVDGVTTELDRITRRATLVAVDTLEPHPDNPRTITPERLEQLKAALVADPGMLEARPLIALPDGRVIGGNQRLAAARELGWKKIPAVVVDLDADTAKLWMLRDNNGYGEWDDGALTAMLEGLGGSVDLALAGFDDAELERLLAPIPADRGEPPEPGPVPEAPRSQRGEVYELGPHRLMCGDATDATDVATLLGATTIECVWTDPPYGVDYVGKTADALTITNDDLGADGLLILVRDALAHACLFSAPGAAIYVCHGDTTGLVFRQAFADAGWTLKQVLVWVKQQFVMGRQDYQWQHEPILYGWKPGGPHRWYAGRSETTVIDDDVNLSGLAKPELVRLIRHLQNELQTTVTREDRPHVSDTHPTVKPVSLVRRFLENSAKAGDAIYDPFAGSGSTMFAADQHRCRTFLMELDPGYCDVIRDRWAAWNV